MAESQRLTTIDRPYVIENASLGLLNLVGEAADDLLARDRADLAPVFAGRVQVSTRAVPRCNLLFLYCALDTSARVSGTEFSLRGVIKAAGAHVAVVASEVPAEILMAPGFGSSLGSARDWSANIVITMNRNGDSFGRFFRELFSQMQDGKTMPMAWVTLAPQVPQQSDDIPGTVCLMEAGHIAFGARKD